MHFFFYWGKKHHRDITNSDVKNPHIYCVIVSVLSLLDWAAWDPMNRFNPATF